jgi:hypothetical protein
VLIHSARIVCPEPVLGETIILGIKWRRQKGVFGQGNLKMFALLREILLRGELILPIVGIA